MIQINLLPVKSRKRTGTANQFIYVYVLGVALASGVIAYLWIAQANEIARLESRLTQLQQEVSQYAKFDQMLKELTKRKELVDKKRAIIKDLQNDRDVMVRVLSMLSISVPPEKIWFERFSQSGDSVTLDGVAISNEAIVEFMRNLEASPYTQKGSVSLTHSRQTLLSNMKLREFQVMYRFLPYSQVSKQVATQKP